MSVHCGVSLSSPQKAHSSKGWSGISRALYSPSLKGALQWDFCQQGRGTRRLCPWRAGILLRSWMGRSPNCSEDWMEYGSGLPDSMLGWVNLACLLPSRRPFTLRAQQLGKHPRSQQLLLLQGAKEQTVSGLYIRANPWTVQSPPCWGLHLIPGNKSADSMC
jgi:hypothetical protein